MGVFVVQVVGGQEDRAAALIAKIAQGAVEDCFVPKREVMHRKSWPVAPQIGKAVSRLRVCADEHTRAGSRGARACARI